MHDINLPIFRFRRFELTSATQISRWTIHNDGRYFDEDWDRLKILGELLTAKNPLSFLKEIYRGWSSR